MRLVGALNCPEMAFSWLGKARSHQTRTEFAAKYRRNPAHSSRKWKRASHPFWKQCACMRVSILLQLAGYCNCEHWKNFPAYNDCVFTGELSRTYPIGNLWTIPPVSCLRIYIAEVFRRLSLKCMRDSIRWFREKEKKSILLLLGVIGGRRRREGKGEKE